MMRLPRFRYYRPRAVAEAAQILAGEDGAMVVAGGTDLLPNMKRRQQTPALLIALGHIEALKKTANGAGLTIGAGLTLSAIAEDEKIKKDYRGLWQAVSQVATPLLRNMGTIGGNLCLDTRCNYYNQNLEWRKAIDFCMKKDGQICWVATGSKKCLALSATDAAPMLTALNARVRLVSAAGERDLPLEDLHQDDGIHYLRRQRDEILTEIILPPANGVTSAYWKLRRRGSFDFPALSVAVAAALDRHGHVANARIVLGAVASCPVVCEAANRFLQGKPLTDETIEEASALCAKVAAPVDNADFTPRWRKRVLDKVAADALRELRGDDMSAVRAEFARQALP